MNIPVEAANTLFAPRPIRPFSSFKCSNHWTIRPGLPEPPAIISGIFKGWPSFSRPGEEEYFSPVDLHDRTGDFPHDADTPTSQQSSRSSGVNSNDNGYEEDSAWYPSALRRKSSGEASFSTARSTRTSDASIARERCNSIDIGNQVNQLLNKDDVKEAINVLQEAISYMHLVDDENEEKKKTDETLPPSKNIAKIYSEILQTLCRPNIIRIVNEISNVDITKKKDLYDSVTWRLFTKVIEAGYQLEHDAHIAVVIMLMDYAHPSLALEALYSLSRDRWKTSTYMLAITLHMEQTPKQVQEVEVLLGDYGKDYIEIANPLAPTDLPALHIETPLMNNVTDKDRLELWKHYQNQLDDSDWNREKAVYEKKRRISMIDIMSSHGHNLKDWALRRMSIETEAQRVERETIEADNTMIYTTLKSKQFEYGWQVFERMKESVNEFTPRVAMHLCWCAYQDIPLMSASRRIEWENRAWSLYSQFMCSEYLHPDQAETPGFLCDLLSITVTSSENLPRARYTKAMSVYQLLERLQFTSLLCNEHVLTPILCTLLIECKGSPTDIVAVSRQAFRIWRTKLKAEKSHGRKPLRTFSTHWALLIFCVKSGDINDFKDVLDHLDEQEALPTSLLAPIQEFHDRHLCERHCYFHRYLLKAVEHTEVVQMDKMGFVMTPQTEKNSSGLAEPIAYLDHALHKRTNINETQATSLAMAAAIGAAKDEHLSQHPAYCTPNKARALVRHCLAIARSKQKK